MTIPDLHVPPCPRCGDPVTFGCRPGDGYCAILGSECQDEPGSNCDDPTHWHWQRTDDGGWYSGPGEWLGTRPVETVTVAGDVL